jgi:hypothetical protein
MPRQHNLKLTIASPCPMAWNEMTGDDRVRHCARCNLNVYNFAAMTTAEAVQLIESTEGRLQRLDGTVMTRDCPVGVWAVRKRLAGILAGVAALIAFLAGGAGLFGLERWPRLRMREPFARICAWLDPPRQGFLAGMISVPNQTPSPAQPQGLPQLGDPPP